MLNLKVFYFIILVLKFKEIIAKKMHLRINEHNLPVEFNKIFVEINCSIIFSISLWNFIEYFILFLAKLNKFPQWKELDISSYQTL